VIVNCNPETVSTDYDTSDRLYFEPVRAEEVLEVCARERAVGVVIQFGGQTPLKLASALEEAGFEILGTPFAAVDLAEDRGRFAALAESVGIAVPEWEMVDGPAAALAAAARIGFPVLARPSYVLGGRAMRICQTPAELRAAIDEADGPVLIDRFLERAIEFDVDAVCDGEDTYIGAIMQHVELAGVHSGDSSCVLPPPRLEPQLELELRAAVRRLGRALGVRGLFNVQFALADGALFVLEANPRASRTVPFASKARGVNLVDAACRIAAGARLASLDLPPERAHVGVSVKAAVTPFVRLPGADPLLGPEMRSTGEVMATADDLATAVAKAERAAGRRLPSSGTVLCALDPADARDAPALVRQLVTAGLSVVATLSTARALNRRGAEVPVAGGGAGREGGTETMIQELSRREYAVLVGTDRSESGSALRRAAVASGVLCYTTVAAAQAAADAAVDARVAAPVVSLQERTGDDGYRTNEVVLSEVDAG
jgi:carbamoyl-phosphate synthase large subunit